MEFEDFDFITSEAPARASEPADPLQRLKYLVDNTPAIIYSTVPSGDFKMTFVSANALNVLGYRPEEMVADPNFWFDHIHPDDAPNIFSSLAQIFSEGEKAYEYRFRTADGRYLWMHDQLRLIRDEQGAPLEVIGSLTDITDRKQMEETLLQAQNMASIGQLAAGVAHEINNPIGYIFSNFGALQEYLDQLFAMLDAYQQAEAGIASAEVRQGLHAMRQQVELDYLREDIPALMQESKEGLVRVRHIVQDLKDFSRVDAQQDWVLASLQQGIEATLNIVGNELRYKADVVRDYAALPDIECLPQQLNQVVMNLVVNAMQALGSQRGTITVRSGREGEQVWFSVSDNGRGIAPENLERIFEPFFTTKAPGKGTGLGLSLARGIVHKHHGRIEVESAPGQGAAFRVTLPIRHAR